MSDKLEIYGLDQATMTKVVRKLENKGGKKIGLGFLPFYDSATEETMWDVVRATNPLAKFRAVDGEAELVGRQAFDRAYADVVSIARKERFNMSDLRKIREAGMLPIVDGKISMVAQMAAESKEKIRQALLGKKYSKERLENTSIGLKKAFANPKVRSRMSLAKGGTGIPYENNEYPAEFYTMRPIIKERDNYKCQMSGMTEEEHKTKFGQALTVHHIDYKK